MKINFFKINLRLGNLTCDSCNILKEKKFKYFANSKHKNYYRKIKNSLDSVSITT